MKKLLFLILMISCILISGCTDIAKIDDANYEKSQNESVTMPIEVVNDSKEYVSEYFQDDISDLRYEGQFIFQNIDKIEVAINMKTYEESKNGKLFELYLDTIKGVPNERLSLGYFFEVGDKIYKINPTEENLEMIKDNEEVPDDSIIVSQSSELPDVLAEGEAGFHHYINIEDGKIKYHSYNDLIETGYYESFTWEKGTGLVFYQSGYGAERETIKLNLISNQ